jgi:AraC-like DNA-binding protein
VARQMNTSAHAGIVLATFRPAAAGAFFAEPLHELFGKSAPLDQFVPASAIDRAASQVAAAPGPAQRVTAMERLLLDLLCTPRRDRLVAAAVSALSAAHGAIRIGQLSRDLEISRDRLERRFRHVVGMRPKQFANLLRVRRAIDLHGSGSSLTRAAIEAGYCDQSHFIRDFKLVTGEAPRRFLSATQHC